MNIPPLTPANPFFAKNVSERFQVETWIKDDSGIHPWIGGNKGRKLFHILTNQEQNFDTIITFGAIGSNHVLATSVFGSKLSRRVYALVTPHPAYPKSLETVRQTIALGTELVPCKGDLDLLIKFASLRRKLKKLGRHVLVIPPGGTNLLGTVAYMEAINEIPSLNEFSTVIVPWASGGTFSGLLAGNIVSGIRTRILGVRVRKGMGTSRIACRYYANQALKYVQSQHRLSLSDIKFFDTTSDLAYGEVDEKIEDAISLFSLDNIKLDPTYTAKAVRAVNQIAKSSIAGKVLFWNTYAPFVLPHPSVEIPGSLSKILI